MISNSVRRAQEQVESRNFQARKRILEYDDVLNKQREVIYAIRRDILMGEDVDTMSYVEEDRKSTRLNSSHANISYAVFCLKKKKHLTYHLTITTYSSISSSPSPWT